MQGMNKLAGIEGVSTRAGRCSANTRRPFPAYRPAVRRPPRVQWLAGVGCALWISPHAWEGLSSHTHPHIWAALLLGGAIVSFRWPWAWRTPGGALTRHVVAVGQMLMGGLLIHLTGRRLETHFHVFGSLAFLAFYRDWRVL